MAGQNSQDVLKQTVDGFASRVQQYADGIAGRLGQPLSGTQLSQDEAVARWNFSPLGSTQAADAQYHALVAQGTAPGQALAQVYPMRQMLYHGASLQDQIKTAQQIQGWAAESSGRSVPEPPPNPSSTLPMLMAAQRLQPTPPPSAVGPALPPLPQGPPPPPVPGMS